MIVEAKLIIMEELKALNKETSQEEINNIISMWPSKENLINNGAETTWQSLANSENNDKGLYVIKRNDTHQI